MMLRSQGSFRPEPPLRPTPLLVWAIGVLLVLTITILGMTVILSYQLARLSYDLNVLIANVKLD